MEEPDTAAILAADELDGGRSAGGEGHKAEVEAEAEAELSVAEGRRLRCPLPPPPRCPLPLSVEPVLFLSMFSLSLQAPLATQYLWERIGDDLGYNGSRRRAACTNGSAAVDPLQQEVQRLTAHWNAYLSVAGLCVGVLVVPLLGSWSDVAGRRPLLVVPALGLALQAAVYLLVMYLRLPVAYLLLGRLLSGLSGDFNAILAACFAYAADTSDRKSRTFRVALLEACLGLSGMLASIVGGQWRRAQGYINPFWLVVVSSLASALYAFLFVRESVAADPSARLLSLRHYKAVWRLLSTGGGGGGGEGGGLRRRRLWLYMLSFFAVVAVHMGSRELYVLYELSAPLCWGPALVGYGSAAQHLAYLSSLGGLRAMQRCVRDSWVAVAGLASNMSGLLLFSLADSTQLMFAGYAVCFLSMAATPVIRSKLSKLVDQSEQGALFSCVACVESLCFLVGSSVFNAVYPASLHFMKGFPFLLGAIILLLPAAIIGSLQCLEQRELREQAAA